MVPSQLCMLGAALALLLSVHAYGVAGRELLEGKTFTMDDVAKHNVADSAWIVVSCKVSDVTKWLPQHPGGQNRILKVAGKDATAKFMAQHGSNQRAQTTLVTYYIGDLVPYGN